MTTRRDFLKAAGMAGAGALVFHARAFPFSQTPTGVTKFLATLPALGPGGANNLGNYLTVLSPNKSRFPGTDYYEVVVKDFAQQVHPAIPATRFMGYADAA